MHPRAIRIVTKLIVKKVLSKQPREIFVRLDSSSYDDSSPSEPLCEEFIRLPNRF